MLAEGGILEKLALDIKVINALGQGHADATENDPQVVMDKYYTASCACQDVARGCAARGITYMPLVFTAQGGVGRHAEHTIARIATAISQNGGGKADDIKAEFIKKVGCELARHAVRKIARRQVRHNPSHISDEQRALREAITAGWDSDAVEDGDDP